MALAGKRDKIRTLEPAMQIKMADFIWRRTVMPRQQANWTKPEDKQADRERFIKYYLGLGKDFKLPEAYGAPEVKKGIVQKTGAALEAAGAGVAGGAKNLINVASDVSEKIETPIVGAGAAKAAGKPARAVADLLNKYVEAPAYANAQEVDPTIARYAAGAGKTIPSILAAEAGAGLVPPMPTGAGALTKVATRAAKGLYGGGAGMVPFTTDPKEIAKGALYSAAGEQALGPIMERLGGSSASRRTAAPKASPTPVSPAQAASGGISDISERVAQAKFGKGVSELTADQSVEHAKAVRAELQSQASAAKAAKATTVKPKSTAAQAKAAAKEQARKRAEGMGSPPPGPEAHASKTASPSAAAPQVIPEQEAAKQAEAARLLSENQAEQARLAEAAQRNAKVAAEAQVQNKDAAKAVAAMKDFGKTEPTVSKIPEGQHGKGPLGKRAGNAERKAAERVKAAAEQPSSNLVVGTEGDIGRKPGRQTIEETPTVEIESDFKQLSPDGYKVLQSLKKKGKWDDDTYRGYLMEWFTKLLEKQGGAK